MRALLFLALLLPSIATAQTPAPETPSPVATAVPAPDVKQLRTTGQQQLRLGRYEDALASLLQVYAASPDSELVLSIARCYRELQDWQKAAFYAEEYLQNANAPERSRAEAILAEAKEEQQRDREMDRLTKLLGSEEAPAPAANPAPERSVIAPPAVPVERTKKKSNRRGILWGAAGVLAVGAVAGGIAAATAPSSETRTRETLPAGDLGTLDRRTE